MSSETFNEKKLTSKYFFVDFYADWCKPCKEFTPTFEEYVRNYSSVCKFMKINIDDDEELADEYNITKVPTFIFFEDGEQKCRITGPNKDEIDNCFKVFSDSIIDLAEF